MRSRVLLPSWAFEFLFFFENVPCLAVVCVGVACEEDGGAVGGVPRFAIALRTRGGGGGRDVMCVVVWGGGFDVG